MSDPAKNGPDFASMIAAVDDELAAITRDKRSVILFDGEKVEPGEEGFIYKFEVPEGVSLSNIEDPDIQVGGQTIKGEVVGVDNQFLRIQLSDDLGEEIPELTIRWSTKMILNKLREHLVRLKDSPKERSGSIVSNLFSFNGGSGTPTNTTFQVDESRNSQQKRAILAALSRDIVFIWGPPGTGKTSTIGFIAAYLAQKGRRVLVVSNTNRAVDVAMQHVLSASKIVGLDWQSDLTRYGQLYILNDPDLRTISFEHQVSREKERLEQTIQKKRDLLNQFRRLKGLLEKNSLLLTQIEDSRTKLVNSQNQLAATQDEIRKIRSRLHPTAEVTGLKAIATALFGPTRAQLETKLKMLTSKTKTLDENVSEFRSVLNNREGELNKSLTTVDMERLKLLENEIKSLGGAESVQKEIEAQLKVDVATLLQKRKVIGATVAKVVTNSTLTSLKVDTVIIDEASMVGLPFVAVLAASGQKSIVIAGDPQQLAPIAMADTEIAKNWLQKDIFMRAAGVDDPALLFPWQHRYNDAAIFLDTQYRMPESVSNIVNEVFYGGRLKNASIDGSLKADSGIMLIDTSSMNPVIQRVGNNLKGFNVYNPFHTAKTISFLKHLIMNGQIRADECGIVMPLNSAAQYMRKELRKSGIRNIEVGTIHTFQGREKELIIFDTVMAGVNYRIRPFDETRSGKNVERLLNVALSRTKNTLIVLADMGHFGSTYPNGIVYDILKRIGQSSAITPDVEESANAFDELDVEKQIEVLESSGMTKPKEKPAPLAPETPKLEIKGEEAPVASELRVVEGAVKMREVKTEPKLKEMAEDRAVAKQIAKDARRMIALRVEVNHLYSKTKGKALFVPSVEGERITSSLPFEIVGTEKAFADWIGKLYRYFYDASGGQNCPSIVNDKKVAATKVLWVIRVLRNSFEHDSAQAEGADKIRQKTANIYRDVIGSDFPRKSSEWQAMQISVMSRIVEWLEYLERRIQE